MYHYHRLKNRLPNRELTAAAREALRGHWSAGAGVTLLVFLISIILPLAILLGQKGCCYFFEGPKLLALLMIFGILTAVLGLIAQIAGLVMPHYFLRLFDCGNSNFSESFGAALRRFATYLWAAALIGIIVFLKLLLFIIPGILAMFDYMMTILCLLDDPELRPGEALKRSRAIMHGHRWQFFCLSWRFFGWGILCFLTLGIGFLWLAPYMQTTAAAFYRSVMPQKEDALYLELPEVKHRPWSASSNTFWLILVLLFTILQHTAEAWTDYHKISSGENVGPVIRTRSAPTLPAE